MCVNIKSIQQNNSVCVISLREVKEICEQIRYNVSVDKNYSYVEIESLHGFAVQGCVDECFKGQEDLFKI